MTGPVVGPEQPGPPPTAGEPGGPREAGGPDGPSEPPEWLLAVGGTAVGLIAAVVTAIIEALYSPLRVGAVRVPLSPVLAAVFNVLIVWFTYRVTRRQGLALLTGVAWLGVMIAVSDRRTEGDIVLAGNNWMALLTILVGTAAWVVAAYRLITARMRPPGPRRPEPRP